MFFLALTIFAQPTYINISNCGTSAINGNYKLSTGNYNCVGCDGYDQITLPSETPTGTVLYRETFTSTQWHASTSGFGTCFAFNLVVLTGAVNCDPTTATNAGTCVVTSGLLPVELVAFEAEERNENIHLSWSTASEINNEGFEIERSIDGRNFDFIDFVEGHGNTTIMKDYSYKDDNVKEGQTYYYRLRQVDFDGAFEYSKIVAANLQVNETIAGNFYPNPTAKKTRIDFVSQVNDQWNVEAFSLSGQLIWQSSYQLNKGINTLNLDFSEFSTGLYLIKFENKTQSVYRKLSIQD